MGLFKRNDKKKKNEISDNTEEENTCLIDNYDQLTEKENPDEEDNEMKEVSTKNFYIYIAFEGDHVFIGKDGNCVLSSTVEIDKAENVKMYDWNTPNARKSFYAKEDHRVEFQKPHGIDKKDWEKMKQQKKEELKRMFKEEIEEAKQMLFQKDSILDESQNVLEPGNLLKDDRETEKKDGATIDTHIVCEKGDDASENIMPKQEKIEMSKGSEILDVAENIKKLGFDIKQEFSQLNEDMSNNATDTIESVSREIRSSNDFLEGVTKNSAADIKHFVNDVVTRSLSNSIHSEASTICLNIKGDNKNNTEEIIRGTKSIQKKLDKLDEICEATEMMEGKLAKLDKVDEITRVLSDKGVDISREFPPTCEEEEDIINLVRYSQKITEQLGYAARDLIRKRAYFDSKSQSMANEQALTDKKIKEAYSAGEAAGKLYVLKTLLSKYADVDTIIDSDDSHVHALWPMMQELGVTVDGEGTYKKGTEVNLSESDVERMAAIYKKIDTEGTYKVVKTGLIYHDEVIFKAEFEKVLSSVPDDEAVVEKQELTNEKEFEQVEDNEKKPVHIEETIVTDEIDDSSILINESNQENGKSEDLEDNKKDE